MSNGFARKLEAMRAANVMRLVLLGTVGFGIGWAIAGFFNSVFVAITAPKVPPGHGAELPPWWTTWLPYLSWFFTGACGEAGALLDGDSLLVGEVDAPLHDVGAAGWLQCRARSQV